MIGTTVGSWVVLGVLGEGGMGRVYMAEHQLIGKRAAIKVLLPQYSANAEIVNRFFNEARASSMLKHPGVVDVYDFGRLGDGSAYLVMEFLDGESLSARLRRQGRLPLDVVVDLARQIANTLAAAHARGIVHRDLKPDNVFLVPDADTRTGVRTKILDFGIAKLTDDKVGGNNAATRTGAIIGTPTYMSPEQCRGAGRVDHRSDIYSLGCLCFEMSSGQPPFSGEGPGEVIAAHLFQPPPSLTGLVPPPMEALLASLLAKSPADRPQTMADVANALNGLNTVPQRRSDALPTLRMPAMDELPHASTPAPVPQPPRAITPARGAQPRRMTTPVPSPPAAAPITTLGAAAGELRDAGGAPLARRLTVMLAAVVVVLGITAVVIRYSNRAPAQTEVIAAGTSAPAAAPAAPATPPAAAATAPPAPAPEAKQVTLTVDTQPSGAEVFRAVDGVRLGRTPYATHHAQSDGEAVFRLRLKGYRDAEVSLPLAGDVTRTITLEHAAHKSAEKPPEAIGDGPAPSKPAKADKKPIKNGVVDPFAE